MAYYSDDNLVTVEDDLAARQVIARLNHALDAADYASYAAMFATDGVFVSGFGNAVGPEQVEAAMQQVAPFITNKRHVAGNLVISVIASRSSLQATLSCLSASPSSNMLGRLSMSIR